MIDPFPPQPPAYPGSGPALVPPVPQAPVVPPVQPGYAPPPGAYAVPVGGYQAPTGGYIPPQAPAAGSSMLGGVSLALGLVALILIPIIGAVFGAQIGAAAPDFFLNTSGTYDDLAALAPARTQVLWAEIVFWIGTILGITAIVLGIASAVRRRGRGLGITGLVLAAIAPIAFLLATGIGAGFGAASTISSF
ncbi:hypothetical protein [Microbacterium sp. NPDC057650]|uniref:hypothetical protein n=1 Tax=unclassified Microbacterium TaxID=2609290 RepID=UPI00366D4B58